MLNKITSLTNPRIKEIVKLRNHKYRVSKSLTVVEGGREILAALLGAFPVKELFFCPDKDGEAARENDLIISKFNDLGLPVYEVTELVFDKISYGKACSGILCLCGIINSSIDDLPAKEDPFFVVIETVEKPGNLGAILRTCDGAGVDAVILCNEKTDMFNPNVIKSSLGAIFNVKTISSTNEQVGKYFKENNVRICASLPDAKGIYTEADLSGGADGGVAIVMGSEHEGLSDFWKQAADVKLSIPMQGHSDSLNVSVSTAILVYEALRQRHLIKK